MWTTQQLQTIEKVQQMLSSEKAGSLTIRAGSELLKITDGTDEVEEIVTGSIIELCRISQESLRQY